MRTPKAPEDIYKFTVTLDEDLYNQVEDFRFENRYQTRKDAIIDLLKKGVQKIKEEADANGKKR